MSELFKSQHSRKKEKSAAELLYICILVTIVITGIFFLFGGMNSKSITPSPTPPVENIQPENY